MAFLLQPLFFFLKPNKLINKVNLQRYGTAPLEFATSKNAIELAAEAEVSYALIKVCEVVELGDFDALLEKQAQFGIRVTQKN